MKPVTMGRVPTARAKVFQGRLSGVIVAFVLTLLALAVAIAVLVAVGEVVVAPPDMVSLRSLFVEQWWGYLRPEPLERFVYLGGVLLLVPLVHGAMAVAGRSPVPPRIAEGISWAVVLGLCLLVFPTQGLASLFARDASTKVTISPAMGVAIGGAFLVAAILVRGADANRFLRERGPRMGRRINVSLLVFVLVLTAGTRPRTADMVVGDLHFEAIFYAVTQVVAGKTLLVTLSPSMDCTPNSLPLCSRLEVCRSSCFPASCFCSN